MKNSRNKTQQKKVTGALTLFDQDKQDFLQRINFDADMVSLTDLWKEAGSTKGKNPNDWTRQESTQQLIETLAFTFNTVSNRILQTRKGRTGGTYAHKSIALAYAKYLDARIHVLVNEIFFQRVEEEKNPDLIIDRAVSTYKRKGHSDEWITKRISGKSKRNELTSTLAKHGVNKDGFRNCTNAIYTPLWGGSTAVIREKKNLTKTDNIRDNMSDVELTALMFAETLSKDTIEKKSLYGNAKCELACSQSSKIVANALLHHKAGYAAQSNSGSL